MWQQPSICLPSSLSITGAYSERAYFSKNITIIHQSIKKMHTRQLFSLLSWKWCTCDKTAEFNCTLICTKVIKNSIIKLKIIKLKYHCTIINLEGQKIALAKKSSGTLSTPGDQNPGFMLGRKLQHPQPSARRCPWWELLGSGAPPAASLPHCLGWHCAVTPNISRDHNPVIAARDSQLTRVKIRKGEGNKNKKKWKEKGNEGWLPQQILTKIEKKYEKHSK